MTWCRAEMGCDTLPQIEKELETDSEMLGMAESYAMGINHYITQVQAPHLPQANMIWPRPRCRKPRRLDGAV